MCELLGISAAAPVNARFSLRRLARRGRTAGEPIDGWGVVLHDGGDVRCYREPEPAGKSAWLRFVERHQPPARILISHIRPVGESDSERAFCALLGRLAALWRGAAPSVEARLAEVRRFAADLRGLGPANFLYSDG